MRNKELTEFKQKIHHILKDSSKECIEKLNEIYGLL